LERGSALAGERRSQLDAPSFLALLDRNGKSLLPCIE
jgi:hypothetical protein